MSDYLSVGGLKVAPLFKSFIEEEALPGTGVDASTYWMALERIFAELGPENRALLDMREAPQHAHFKARGSFIDIDGVTQPAPVPRFSRSQAEAPEAFAGPGIGGRELLLNWGFDQARVDALQAQGVIGAPKGA